MLIESKAIPILKADIDTDAILPARFLLLMSKTGLGDKLFMDTRGDDSIPINDPQLAGASLIVAGKKFGIGSSREQAVWACYDFGIRCIIALSFGEIFRTNCINNGILPIELSEEDHAKIKVAAIKKATLRVDLVSGTISDSEKLVVNFQIESSVRVTFLTGRDPINSIIAEHANDIDQFELRRDATAPWLQLSKYDFEFLARKGTHGK